MHQPLNLQRQSLVSSITIHSLPHQTKLALHNKTGPQGPELTGKDEGRRRPQESKESSGLISIESRRHVEKETADREQTRCKLLAAEGPQELTASKGTDRSSAEIGVTSSSTERSDSRWRQAMCSPRLFSTSFDKLSRTRFKIMHSHTYVHAVIGHRRRSLLQGLHVSD